MNTSARVIARATYLRARLRSPGRARWLLAAIHVRRLRCWSLREFRMYSLSASDALTTHEGDDLRRDVIEDLRLYRPFTAADLSEKDFWAQAMQRLEQGMHVYTSVTNGLLLHYSWLEERTGRAGSDFGHEFRLPEPAAVLWDDYTWPSARGRGLQTRSIRRRVRDAATAGSRHMFIGVRADNPVSLHNIEKVGFEHWASGWAQYRFGCVKRWVTYAHANATSDV